MIRRIIGLPIRVLKRALNSLDGERGAPSPAPPMTPVGSAATPSTPTPKAANTVSKASSKSSSPSPKKAAPKKAAPKKAAPKKAAPKKAAPKKAAPKKAAPKKAAPKKASSSVDPQETPNPNAMKFALSVKVAETGSFSFNATDTEIEHPIAAAVVALDGVVSIFGVNDFVTVSKAEDADWSALIPVVVDAIKSSA